MDLVVEVGEVVGIGEVGQVSEDAEVGEVGLDIEVGGFDEVCDVDEIGDFGVADGVG